mmetsp:Transcript_12330/g.29289  ORF Transcript_12330/g.29289 Transcript_12330/m.29289 type:complete len:650 (-) Transcript_12330:101-2050(-)
MGPAGGGGLAVAVTARFARPALADFLLDPLLHPRLGLHQKDLQLDVLPADLPEARPLDVRPLGLVQVLPETVAGHRDLRVEVELAEAPGQVPAGVDGLLELRVLREHEGLGPGHHVVLNGGGFRPEADFVPADRVPVVGNGAAVSDAPDVRAELAEAAEAVLGGVHGVHELLDLPAAGRNPVVEPRVDHGQLAGRSAPELGDFLVHLGRTLDDVSEDADLDALPRLAGGRGHRGGVVHPVVASGRLGVVLFGRPHGRFSHSSVNQQLVDQTAIEEPGGHDPDGPLLRLSLEAAEGKTLDGGRDVRGIVGPLEVLALLGRRGADGHRVVAATPESEEAAPALVLLRESATAAAATGVVVGLVLRLIQFLELHVVLLLDLVVVVVGPSNDLPAAEDPDQALLFLLLLQRGGLGGRGHNEGRRVRRRPGCLARSVGFEVVAAARAFVVPPSDSAVSARSRGVVVLVGVVVDVAAAVVVGGVIVIVVVAAATAGCGLVQALGDEAEALSETGEASLRLLLLRRRRLVVFFSVGVHSAQEGLSPLGRLSRQVLLPPSLNLVEIDVEVVEGVLFVRHDFVFAVFCSCCCCCCCCAVDDALKLVVECPFPFGDAMDRSDAGLRRDLRFSPRVLSMSNDRTIDKCCSVYPLFFVIWR